MENVDINGSVENKAYHADVNAVRKRIAYTLSKGPKFVKIAEDIDFYKAFKKIEKRFDVCFLLESLGDKSLTSRYGVIGFDPRYILKSKDVNTLHIEDCKEFVTSELKCDNAYYALREFIPQKVSDTRYVGGLVGYVGYDAINYLEPSLNIKQDENFYAFKFGVYFDGLVYDQVTGEVFYFFYDESRFQQIKNLIFGDIIFKNSLKVEYVGDSVSKEEYFYQVEYVKSLIKKGFIFQCEVGIRSNYEIDGDSILIYEQLRKINPSPHMYYFKFGVNVITGASPELLFKLSGVEVETYPLAGTTTRGNSEFEDTKYARELINNPKENAEHNMLIDLHRNDLGKVARVGSVFIKNLKDIKKFSHVQHISSQIVGLIANHEDAFSGLAACFPAGTLSGAPKIEAIKISNSLEVSGRGPYGGAVGYFSFSGDCKFAIPIRSVFISDKKAFVQTSGGIVCDSVLELEYEEIQRKLEATKTTLRRYMVN
ncbi:anthranilate synthase component I family protein [Sessilibacter corallicola]|uniref:anthranilate synthase component I family protein n=1 Tax=Sessilibacter corallicola TaxID=2904075 RepID=UPI001E3B0713|nr:anthranilate synthase component I family protein [Sessilibacter corallicola]MCE2026704.1 anthranilate synthase component I family protein [Sessilibacter corallicola]